MLLLNLLTLQIQVEWFSTASLLPLYWHLLPLKKVYSLLLTLYWLSIDSDLHWNSADSLLSSIASQWIFTEFYWLLLVLWSIILFLPICYWLATDSLLIFYWLSADFYWLMININDDLSADFFRFYGLYSDLWSTYNNTKYIICVHTYK